MYWYLNQYKYLDAQAEERGRIKRLLEQAVSLYNEEIRNHVGVGVAEVEWVLM